MIIIKYFLPLTILISLSIQAEPSNLKIALILDSAGKDDQSFNASAYQGLIHAEKAFNVIVKTAVAPDNNAFEGIQRSFINKNFDLIIGVGFHQLESIQKCAIRFPNQKFLLIDGKLDLPNVLSVTFEEQEGSFLMGALAAMHSKTGKIGFIGGMDIPLIKRFQIGYQAGIKYINPQASLFVNYLGITAESWNNPPKAKELALYQYSKGVDIIYSAAGNSGMGVFDAAELKNKLAIGVDSNQNWVKPGFILSSMVKRVDEVVFNSIQKLKQGNFKPGHEKYGLKSKGIDYAIDENNSKLLTTKEREKLIATRENIIQGKINIPDYYLNVK